MGTGVPAAVNLLDDEIVVRETAIIFIKEDVRAASELLGVRREVLLQCFDPKRSILSWTLLVTVLGVLGTMKLVVRIKTRSFSC